MRPLVPSMRQLAATLGVGLVFALATPASHAQSADTLDWKRYYPLEVGNVWEYHGAEARDQITRYTLVADTVANGQTYYRRQLDFALIHYPQAGVDTARSTSFDYVRYDEGGVIAVASVEADTVAFDPCSTEGFERDLRPAFGTASSCPPPLLFPEADSARVEGTYTKMWAPSSIGSTSSSDPVEVAAIKEYTVGLIFSAFVADIGPVSTGNLWGPRLHYARISGVEYGAPSALVSTAPTSRSLDTIQIHVLGNPASEQIAFRVQSPPARDARWTITDALGRTTQSGWIDQTTGSQEINVLTDKLATGSYQLTVVSGEARAAASFAVIR